MGPPIRRVAVPLTALLTVLGRRWMARPGATTEELDAELPGDGLVAGPDLTTTRAVTVHARAAEVWPWIAQLGQGRGGFYSYDTVENMVGCDIHSADRVVPEWQDVVVGAEVSLAPGVALPVAAVEPGRFLVLRGGIPIGPVSAPFTSRGPSCCANNRTGRPGWCRVSATSTCGGGLAWSWSPRR